ncbi:MAG: DUF4905 domain-containing protein [Ignavibacteriales bacterium]|nr:DUF4905 domain-containing protein [Ignavibacteriales bacterium]
MFSFLKSDHLSPEWTYSAGSIIWRMVLCDHGTLVGECRDPEQKVASFFSLDLSTGKALWGDLRLDEQWWVGIEAVQKNVVLLHAFAKPDMPEHKGIRAFDSTSGVQLWRNDDVAYWFGYEDRVIAYRDLFERRVGYELDLQSGVLLKTHDGSLEELHQLRRRAVEEQSIPEVTLPEVFVEEKADPMLVALVGKETKGKELSGRVEFVRQNDILLFNFHVQSRHNTSDPKLENNLVVYRLPNGKRIFADVIGRNLTGYVPDSFFVRGPFVLFIKEQRTLTAVRLWKS